jgi:hypothetical protein
MIGNEAVPPCDARWCSKPREPGRTTVESEETRMDLRALHRHGWSISALARRFRIIGKRPSHTHSGL